MAKSVSDLEMDPLLQSGQLDNTDNCDGDVEEIEIPCLIDDIQVPAPWSQTISTTQAGIEVNFSYDSSIQKDAPRKAILHIAEDFGKGNKEEFKRYIKEDWGKNNQDTFKEGLRKELHFLSNVGHQNKLEALCEFLSDEKIKVQSLTGEESKGTALHSAFLVGQNNSANTLIESQDTFSDKCELIKTAYPKDCLEYAGTNVLHILVAQGNVDGLNVIFKFFPGKENPAKELETKKQLFGEEVTGTFYHNKFKARFPLAMAACSGNMDVFNILVKNGAEVDQKDSDTGHTFLHSLVAEGNAKPDCTVKVLQKIFASQEMLGWWKRKRSSGQPTIPAIRGQEPGLMKRFLFHIQNKMGETPLQLACRLNCSPMIRAILEVDQAYRFPQWRFGNTVRVLYDVTGLSPTPKGQCSGKCNCPDVCFGKPCQGLEQLVYSSECVFGTSRDLGWGKITPITKLMDLRWEAYRVRLLLYFVLHLFLMMWISVTVENSDSRCTEEKNISRYIANTTVEVSDLVCANKRPWYIAAEVLLVISVAIYILSGILALSNIVSAKGNKTHWQTFKSIFVKEGLFGVVLFLFTISLLLFLFCQLTNSMEAHIVLIAISAMTGWTFLLIFTRLYKGICIFTVMLQRIIFGDLVHVTIVFIVITTGFATALRAVFWGQTPPEDMGALPSILYTLFHVMLTGEPLELAGIDSLRATLIQVFVTFFIILSTVQLLNMLIAAMTDTYTEVSQNKAQIWRQNREKVILFLERRLPKCLQPKFNTHFKEISLSVAEYATENNFTISKQTHWLLAVEENHDEIRVSDEQT